MWRISRHVPSLGSSRWLRAASGSSSCCTRETGRMRPVCAFTALLVFSMCQRSPVQAVDRSKFRKCSDTGFCKEYRNTDHRPKFRLDAASVKHNEKEGWLTGSVIAEGPGAPPPLKLDVQCYNDGTSRVRIDEQEPIRKRWVPPDIVLEDQLKRSAFKVAKDTKSVRISYGDDKTLLISLQPFEVDLFVGDTPAVGVNKNQLMHFEHYREKKTPGKVEDPQLEAPAEDKHKGKKVVGYWEDGLAIYEDGTREEKPSEEEEARKKRRLEEAQAEAGDEEKWEEYFGGHTDSRPYGPASVGIDVSFHGSKHLYGLPEHASQFRLKTTKGEHAAYSEPFRLYNLDVFEYELDEPMALYGAIPFVASHTPKLSVGVFYFNPSETFVDVTAQGSGYGAHWLSECGVLDIFLLPGPTPGAVSKQLTTLVGKQALPPIFSLGYHQCRWNYKDEKDVATVHGKFEELDFPYDVLWLDIEHTDGKRYFTWDKRLFPEPVKMQQSLAAQGRRMVTIIDPHIKRDGNWKLHSEATSKGLYIKDKNGNDFDGFCWPGSSSYLDFTSAAVRRWWAEQFALDKYQGSTMDLYTWNDMNEPSVFNGPEVSMPKDCKNLEGVEHREWHNLYGIYMHRATAEGLTLRDPHQLERPFVLSRSFFAGSQRYGAIWTGDNVASWDHLAMATPMLLSISLSGLSFAGADVGGFFQDTDRELMTRWMQAGAFQPFFRGHAHHDTKRKEPWVYGEPTTSHIRHAVMQRYTYLPFWYTQFAIAGLEGLPVMRPLWFEYPQDTNTYDIEDQWLIGADLLVKPVTQSGVTELSVYLPGGKVQPWYDVLTHEQLNGEGAVKVSAPIDKIPVFQRGGSIVPRKMRLRRSSKVMVKDPYTLVVALDGKGKAAQGLLYLDDEHTLKHEKGEYVLRQYSWDNGALASARVGGKAKPGSFENMVERIVVVGLKGKPGSVVLKQGTGATKALDFEYDSKSKVLTIRKPTVKADEDWAITVK